MASEAREISETRANVRGHARISWGIACLAVAALSALGIRLLWAWKEKMGSLHEIFYFHGITIWSLILVATILSGLAAAAGLFCLVRPVTARILGTLLRRLVRVMVGMVVVVATLAWIYCLLAFTLLDSMCDLHQVTSDSGENVLMEPAYRPGSYYLWVQKSALVYEAVKGVEMRTVSGPVVPEMCGLESHGDSLMLSCGAGTVSFPKASPTATK